MLTSIVSIGNSKGIRIPKLLLVESGLDKRVKLKAKKGEIRIIALPRLKTRTGFPSLSEQVLGTDWNRPEEDKAWASLQ